MILANDIEVRRNKQSTNHESVNIRKRQWTNDNDMLAENSKLVGIHLKHNVFWVKIKIVNNPHTKIKIVNNLIPGNLELQTET